MLKSILMWIWRIFDISGSIWTSHVRSAYDEYVLNGFSADKENIKSDFQKSIKIVKNG
jgi:hypothetical protein